MPIPSPFHERTAPLWLQGSLAGRLGAAFTSAGEGAGGGGELTLLRLLAFLAENGCLMVPFHNRLEGFRAAGCHWGVLARTNAGPGGPAPAAQNRGPGGAPSGWCAVLRGGGR